MFGEGELAYQVVTEDSSWWGGALTDIIPESGYWVRVNDNMPFTVNGLPTGSSVTYTVGEGNNLLPSAS